MNSKGSMTIILKNDTKIHLFYDEGLYKDIISCYERKQTGDTLSFPILTEQGETGKRSVVEIEFLLSELDRLDLVRNEVVHFGEMVHG